MGKRVAASEWLPHASHVFGGIATRSGVLFLARGAGSSRVYVVDVRDPLAPALQRVLPLPRVGSRPAAPAGIAVGPTFGIYVADPSARLVHALSLFGAPIGSVGTPAPAGLPVSPDRRGLLAEPVDVAVDRSGNVYVCSAGGPRRYAVLKYARDGRYLGSFRSFGVPEETFSSPRSLAVSDANLFVADTGNGCVQVFGRNGSFRFAFSTTATAGEWSKPMGIALERSCEILVLSQGDEPSLRRFSPGGELRETILRGHWIEAPVAVAAGDDGTLFVLDQDGDRLRSFTPQGEFLTDLISVLEATPPTLGVPPGASYGRPL